MPPTYHELVAQAKSRIREIAAAELEPRLGEVLLVDTREPYEHAPGAVLVPRGVLESQLPAVAPDRDREIVVFCAVGNRSALAAAALQEAGYTRVSSLAGGIRGWASAGYAIAAAPLSPATDHLVRYQRQLVLPQVGEKGQRRLLASKVAIVGAGGLGSPAALYLAAAGVGTIALIDGDRVEVSNLQRQILHDSHRVGQPKVESARRTLSDLNPEVEVRTHPVRLSAANALELLGGYDVVVDGTDSYPTRYLINDASLHLRVPVVHGSVFRFEGQATTFLPYAGPCYRCLFPAPPPPELALPCAEAGVLGAVPGIVGSIEPPRPSSCCSGSASRWWDGSSPTTSSASHRYCSASTGIRSVRPVVTRRTRRSWSTTTRRAHLEAGPAEAGEDHSQRGCRPGTRP